MVNTSTKYECIATMATKSRMAVDEDIAFNTGAFSVVSSWLRGAGGASTVDVEDEPETTVHKPAVQLYRPSKTTGVSTTNGANKELTAEDKEMKKKILRKSGKYRHEMDEDNAADDAEQEREEEELMRIRHGNTETKKTPTPSDSSATQPATQASTTTSAEQSSTGGKKRKISAQEELLEKLREEAARKKAKNLKTKMRQQRKKEEKKKQPNASSSQSAM
ncbi:hypothetical protein Poli38472_012477 [Pythium oligandrum]|uniref:Uncharacterized protein n=1 Tax=Pythium oligandrum TaxID=41045 RepID=A0A8K1CRJ1_PYTOL|nr:hypothetical protein Poli38472_012477 [Pythium oligandrum]|eukprot:TMW67361.1 hypothetical protein Poli38472_012477 [Pythium oligandrum]